MNDLRVRRETTLAHLVTSRAEIRRLLIEPPARAAPGGQPSGAAAGEFFPRSRTLQTLLSGRGLATAGAAAAGLLVARPALVLRLLRMLPAGTIARVLLVKAVAALRAKANGSTSARP